MLQILKNYLWHLPQAIFWNLYYRFPTKKLTIIGITGTDGKTTTCTLVQKLLENSGLKCGIISTLTAPGLHATSPPPRVLQKIFYDYVKLGFTHVVCEVTSHALSQFRYFGANFEIAAITNISHEHLDYHKNIESYTHQKAKIFKHSRLAILNHDDPHFVHLKSHVASPFLTYGIENKSDFMAKNIKLTPTKLLFTIKGQKYESDSNYYYQLYNILCAYAIFTRFNLDLKVFAETIKHFPETKGRREIVPNNLGLKTIVDFAHTPNALTSTLSSLKSTAKGRLIVIFGATGGRDKSKRPLMGKVVSQLADIAIITADDTRHEKIEDINQQIIAGIDPTQAIEINPANPFIQNPKVFHYANIPNRQDAFNLAVEIAKTGDTIIACGKGHESSILHGDTDYPWSEAEAFRTAFRLEHENLQP